MNTTTRKLLLATSLLAVIAACGNCGNSTTTEPPKTAQAQVQPPEDPETGDLPTGDTAAKLRAAVARPSRPAKERARDVYRHPIETLEFFGLKDDMTVVELSPGAGWYTAILAPVLAEKGKLIEASGDPNGPPEKESTKNAKAFLARLQRAPQLYGKVETHAVKADKIESYVLGPDASADMVLTFRNIHGWLRDDGKAMQVVLGAVSKVLKPGGVFGVVEHRAKPDADPKTSSKTGYVPEATVIRLIEAAGFKLADKAEINANPKDTTVHPEGVWSLPPSLEKVSEQDKPKMLEIGESDRMTLKFIKQ